MVPLLPFKIPLLDPGVPGVATVELSKAAHGSFWAANEVATGTEAGGAGVHGSFEKLVLLTGAEPNRDSTKWGTFKTLKPITYMDQLLAF